MRRCALLLVGVVAATPAGAQLAPPNAAGITYGHVHLNVVDIEVHKALWVEHFGGVVVQKGSLTTVRLPGTILALSEREPTGPSRGTVMDHVGFQVPDLQAFLTDWRAAGLEVTSEFAGVEGQSNAYLLLPDDVRVEVQENPSLTVPAEAHHIHFFAEGAPELMDWYVDLFSLSPRARGTIETTADAPGMNVSFSEVGRALEGTRGRAIDHIGFEVDNLEAFCKSLEERGIEFSLAYREIDSIELAIAFFTDPAGVVIELTEGFDRY